MARTPLPLGHLIQLPSNTRCAFPLLRGLLSPLLLSSKSAKTRCGLQVLPDRLAKSKALRDVNRLKIELKGKTTELAEISGKKGASDEEKEVRLARRSVCSTQVRQNLPQIGQWQRTTLRCCRRRRQQPTK